MKKALPVALGVCLALGAATGANAQASSTNQVKLEIRSQLLRDALNEWAQQTGFNLISPTLPATSQFVSPAINGELTARAALERLLAGTSLTYVLVDDRTVVIRERSKSSVVTTGTTWRKINDDASYRVALNDESGAQSDGRVASTRDRAASTVGKQRQAEATEEILVTAQKRTERLQEVPISISLLSGENLDRSTFTGVMESLRTVPGVSTQPGGGVGASGSIEIRGVSPAAGSAPIGYYLDGVPFSLIRASLNPDQNSFDLERVEILRGPQGTLYGASAESGLVRVLTRNADLNQFEFKARSTLSQTDGADGVNYRGDVALNVPLVEGKLAARAVVGYDSTSGWIDTPVKEGSNSTRTRSYRLKINAQPTDQLSIGASSWFHRGYQDAGALSDDNWHRGTTQPEPLIEDYEVHNLQVSYEFPGFTLSSSTGYLDWDGIGTIDYTRYFLFDPNMTTSVVFSKMPSRSISEEVLLNSTSGGSWKWTAGTMYRDIRARLYQSWPGVLAQPISFVDTSKSAAIFGEVGHRFGGDRFEWTLGARYYKDTIGERQDDVAIDPITGVRYIAEKRYSATTPRAVLTWYPSKTATMYASYAQGFRSGLPQDYAAGLGFPGLRDAKPDKLNNYELGAKFDLLNRRLSFDVAVYYMKWDHVIGTFPVLYQNTLVQALGNGNSASGPGVDFSVVVRPADGLEFGVSAGWNDLTQDKNVYLDLTGTTQAWAAGDRLANSPELTSTAFVHLQRSLGASGYRGTLSMSATYTSELQIFLPDTPRRTEQKGNDLVFGQASISVEAPSGWSASLFVDNFTNEKGHFLPSSYYFTDDYLSHYRPRTVGLQLDYRFN